MSGEETLERLTDAQLLHIWVEVSIGRGRHGDFLRSFAEAMSRADEANFSLLRPVSLMLVEKYDLRRYLNNYGVSA